MKFKKGDIVRCIDIKNPSNDTVNRFIVGEIYLVSEQLSQDNLKIYKYFGKFSYNSDKLGGCYPNRFKKVLAEDLTEEEKFEYIKYKLGAKID